MSGVGNYIVDDDAVVRISPVNLQSANVIHRTRPDSHHHLIIT